MSSQVNCPRCGKTFEVPDEAHEGSRRCPHCHAAESESVMVLPAAELLRTVSPTAVTADPPKGPRNTVICPHCGSLFFPGNNPGPWLLCPECGEIDVHPLVRDLLVPSARERAWGLGSIIAGGLSLTAGAFLPGLGRALTTGGATTPVTMPVAWALVSFAVLVVGIRTVCTKKHRFPDERDWSLMLVITLLITFAFCIYVVAFLTSFDFYD
jgi:hypothetical protein